MQGWIVGLLPMVLAVVLNYMRPDLWKPMLNSSFGILLMVGVVAMVAIGLLWIRRMVSIDV